MLANMDNIDKLQRQQGVEWPEFSWETEKGQADPKRCFQMFAREPHHATVQKAQWHGAFNSLSSSPSSLHSVIVAPVISIEVA